jgi:hypothetical protein
MVQGAWMDEAMRQSRIDKTMLKKEGLGWDIGYGQFFALDIRLFIKQLKYGNG